MSACLPTKPCFKIVLWHNSWNRGKKNFFFLVFDTLLQKKKKRLKIASYNWQILSTIRLHKIDRPWIENMFNDNIPNTSAPRIM